MTCRHRRLFGLRVPSGLLAAALLLGVVTGTPALAQSAGGNGDDPTQDPRFQQAEQLFDIWLDAKMAYEKIPGVSVAIVEDQDLVWSRGYGFAHRDEQVPATPTTLYSICSISKLFTSIGVMQQRDGGRLSLSDPIGKHLAWYEVAQAHPDSPPVTIEGILTHSAGLPRESAHPYWTGPDYPFPTRDEIIAGLGSQETLYPASRYFQYSNLGMALAGQIVEAASEEAYADYVQRHILDPLGMEDTYTEIPEQHRDGQLATGYDRLTREGERTEASFFQARGIAPAAGYASTVEELARFASWQFRLLENGGTEILDANTLREMHRVHWVDPDLETMWGLGFAIAKRGDDVNVGHGGSCPGFRSTFQMVPAKKVAGVVMMNAMANPGEVWGQMARILVPALEQVDSDPDGGEEAPVAYAKYEGVYASTWGESAVLRWKDGLAMVGLPTDNPSEAITRLRHEDGDTFRRVRDDGTLGEAYIFHTENGEVVRMSVHGNFSERVSDLP